MSGKEINYISPSVEEFQAALKGYGISAPAIAMTVMFAQGIAQGEFYKTTTTFMDSTGKEITSLKTFFEEVYGSNNFRKISLKPLLRKPGIINASDIF